MKLQPCLNDTRLPGQLEINKAEAAQIVICRGLEAICWVDLRCRFGLALCWPASLFGIAVAGVDTPDLPVFEMEAF